MTAYGRMLKIDLTSEVAVLGAIASGLCRYVARSADLCDRPIALRDNDKFDI